MASAFPIVTLDNVLDEATCAALIDRIECLGPAPTQVRSERGIHADAVLRNNTRVWFDDAPLAARIHDALQRAAIVRTIDERLPGLIGALRPIECEATFRGYRYRNGEYFAPHVDGITTRDDGARTLLTVLVYLNGGADVEGGATHFPDARFSVAPATGRACVFPHLLLHEGAVVERGTKYALRTNVVFV
jgi:prolyl 4-hydroxylase